MRGRRKPTALKVLDGDRPDRINVSEPTPPPGLGEPPAKMKAPERTYWRQLGEMVPDKVATKADRKLAELFCRAHVRFDQVNEALDAEGLTIIEDRGDNGTVTKRHPLLADLHALTKTLLDIMGRFGLDPIGRTRLAIERDSEDNDLLALMRSRRGNRGDGGTPQPSSG